MSVKNDVYRKLQRHIDSNMPINFPETESGVEISLLKQLFTPEEAEIALEISSAPQSVKRIYKRMKKRGINIEELQNNLNNMVEKGAIAGPEYYSKLGMGKKYGKAPFIVGIYEFQAGKLTKEFEKDTRNYIDEKYKDVLFAKGTSQFRTIPISTSITPENYIASYDDAREIIKNTKNPIVVLSCVCREGSDLMSEPCKKFDITDTCLLLNEYAGMYIDFGRGRSITKGEALEVLKRAEDAGLVLRPTNSKKPAVICCCCGCCCGYLVNVKKLPIPAQYFHFNYYAEVNTELCKGCKKCVERCQMEAVSVKDKVAGIDLDRCIGCGVCIPTCPENSIELRDKKNKYIPPKNALSMYQKLMIERYGVWGVFKMMIKSILGVKL